MGFDEVAEAHQLMHDNKHLGKIAILVGADRRGPGQDGRRPRRDPRGGGCLMAGVVHIPWYATRLPRRQARGGAGRRSRRSRCATARRSYAVYRSRDDRYKFLQIVGVREQDRLRALLVRPRVHRLPRRSASSWYQVPVALQLEPTSSPTGALEPERRPCATLARRRAAPSRTGAVARLSGAVAATAIRDLRVGRALDVHPQARRATGG